MAKKELIKTFVAEIYSKQPNKNYGTNKIVYNHNDEFWSIDLADMIDCKTSNNKGFRCIFIIIHNLSKYLWAIPLKNNNSKTIADEFSNILTISRRSPLKKESDRGSEWYKNIFQNFLKVKNIRHISRFTDKGPSTAERIMRTLRNLLKKPVFLAGSANWLSANLLLNNIIFHFTIVLK